MGARVGTAGNNTLIGGGGDNPILGGTGDDLILGGDGDDLIAGIAGNNTLDGGAGNDTITPGTGNDITTTGPGANLVRGSAASDAVTALEEGEEAEDTLVVTSFDGTATETLTITITGTPPDPAHALQGLILDRRGDALEDVAAVINRDGQVTAADALEVLRHAVRLESASAPEWVFVDADAAYGTIGLGNTAFQTGIDISGLNTDPGAAYVGILLGAMQDTV